MGRCPSTRAGVLARLRPGLPARSALPGRGQDAGFSLVETMIALVIFSVLMASLAALFTGGLRTSAGLQDRQTAVTVADQAVEIARSVPAAPDGTGCSRLLQGRTQAAVTAQWAAAPTGVDLTGTDSAWMLTTCSGSTVVPLQGLASTAGAAALDPVPVAGRQYTVNTYIGTCRMARTGGACVPQALASGSTVTMYRVIAAVSWNDAGCSPRCTYSVATLIDPGTDSLFNSRSTAPGAPTQVAAVAGDGQAVVTWAPPTTNLDVAVASYTVTATPSAGGSPSTCTAVAPALTCTVTGLTNGLAYLVGVTASSTSATGPSSALVETVPYPASIMTPARMRLWLDGADAGTLFQTSACTLPALLVADPVGCWKDKSGQANNAVQASTTAEPALATVSRWPVPSFDGASDQLALTSAALLPNGTAPSTTFLVGRMTDPTPATSSWRTLLTWGGTAAGTTRSYQKAASSSSAVVDAVGSPTSAGGSFATGSVAVLEDAWTGPSYTGYLNAAAGSTVSGTFTTGTTTGLVGNQVGGATQYWLGQIPEVIVLAGAVTAAERRTIDEYLTRKWGGGLAPQAPTAVSVGGVTTTSATISFTPPSWDGGSPVTSYTLVATPASGPAVTVTGCTGSPCTISGLTLGTTYTVTVAALNVYGSSAPSSPASATTNGAPGVPTGLTATPGDSTIALTWTPPAVTGGGITGYAVSATSASGSASCSSVTPGCSLTGLTNGVAYTITVTASSAAGTSPPSASVTAVPYPASLIGGTSLRLWLDAADLDGDKMVEGTAGEAGTVAGAVQSWKDKSGWAKDVTAPSAAERPAYTTRTINGLPVVTSDGTQALVGATAADPYSTTGDRTLIVVTRPRVWTDATAPSNGDGTYLVDRSATAATQYPLFSLKVCGSPESWCLQHRLDGQLTATTVSPGTPPVAGRTDILTAIRSAGTDSISVTGATPATGALAGTITQQAVSVHRHASLTSSQDLDVAEVLLFNRALTGAEQTTLQNYLMTKWQVVPVPGAPTGLAAVAGDGTAALTWTAPSSGTVTGYTATAVPSDGTLPTVTCTSATTACSLTGLTDGARYTVTVTATNVSGNGSASGPVTVIPYPASVMTASTLKLWLDGADGTTLLAASSCTGAVATSGQSIGCWKDKSGQADHAIQATAGSQASVSSLNSLSAPTFDGSADYYGLTVAKLPTGTTPSATYAVGVQEDAAPASSCFRHLIAWGANATGNARIVHKTCSSSLAFLDTYGTYASMPATKSWPVGAAAVFDGTVTSTQVTANLNGAASYSWAGAANTGTSSGALLGTSPWGAGYWKGRIPEVIVLATVPTAAQNRTIQEYLARKWGVVITPGPPGLVSATSGNASSVVTWTAPAWTGGAAITGYIATAVPANGSYPTITCSGTGTSCTLAGLSNGMTYTVSVTATNAAGTSSASSSTGISPAAPTLLDQLSSSPVAAYSLRKLRSGYAGSAVTVRRDWDNTTSDIGFTPAGDLDTSALSSFCGAWYISCYASRWYDQSGNGRDAVQANWGRQPKIVSGGVTQTANGLPTLVFSGGQNLATGTSAVSVGGTTLTGNVVGFANWWSGDGRFLSYVSNTTTTDASNAASASVLQRYYWSSAVTSTRNGSAGASFAGTDGVLSSLLSIYDGTSNTIYDGGTASTPVASTGTFGSNGAVTIGSDLDWSSPLSGDISEVTVFSTRLSAGNRSVLVPDQQSYYGAPDQFGPLPAAAAMDPRQAR